MPHFTPNGPRLRVCFNTPPRLSCTALPIQNNRSRQALCWIKSTYNLPSKFSLLEKLVYSQRQLSYKARAITDPIVSRDSYYKYDPRNRCSWKLDSFLQNNQHISLIYRKITLQQITFVPQSQQDFTWPTSAKSIKMRLVAIRRLRLRHFLLLDILGLEVCDQVLIEGRLDYLHSTIILQRGIDPSGTHARSP